ncbi:hypothetical protein AUF62_00885 [archaeon 13_1_20CM_52_20]|nr:MAG: hypothetical protein AUF62_00885 [archaeon 13_1_20CM_52_20]
MSGEPLTRSLYLRIAILLVSILLGLSLALVTGATGGLPYAWTTYRWNSCAFQEIGPCPLSANWLVFAFDVGFFAVVVYISLFALVKYREGKGAGVAK